MRTLSDEEAGVATKESRADDARGQTVAPLLVSVEEAARVLAVGRSMLYELIAADQLETVHIGRCRRVPVDALQSYVERLRAA